MGTWEEFSEYLAEIISSFLEAIKEWMFDLLRFIVFEFFNVIFEIIYFIKFILRGVFKVLIYLGIIYYFVLIFGFETTIDYSNSQIIIELLRKILTFFNDNGGAIQAIATVVLVIVTAKYARITHSMLELQSRRYYLEQEKMFLKRQEIRKKENEEREKKSKEYENNIGLRKRRY